MIIVDNIAEAMANLQRSWEKHPRAVQAILDYLAQPDTNTITIYAQNNTIFKTNS